MCRDTCCDRRREQPSRTTNQGRRQHALPRRHGHDRTTSWPDSPRGSLTAPLAASGVLPIWPLPLWAFGISRCQSACSSPTAHGSSCTCVAESITHATYNRLESVPGPHSVRQRVYESVSPKVEVATRTSLSLSYLPGSKRQYENGVSWSTSTWLALQAQRLAVGGGAHSFVRRGRSRQRCSLLAGGGGEAPSSL